MTATKSDLENVFATYGVNVEDGVYFIDCEALCRRFHITSAEDFFDEWYAHACTENPMSQVLNEDSIVSFTRHLEAKAAKNLLPTKSPAGPSKTNTPVRAASRKRPLAADEQSPISTPKRQSITTSDGWALPMFSPHEKTPTSRVYSSGKRSGVQLVVYKGTKCEPNCEGIKGKIEIIQCRSEPFPMTPVCRMPTYVCRCVDEHIMQMERSAIPEGTEVSVFAGDHENDDTIFGQIHVSNSGNLEIRYVGGLSHSLTDNNSSVKLYSGKVALVKVSPANVKSDQASTSLYSVTECIPLTLPSFPTEDITLTGKLEIVIASGPFTTLDSLSYEPLKDFVDQLLKDPPHVCVLFGPFIASKHKHVRKTFNDSFAHLYVDMVQKLVEKFKGTHTRLCVINSPQELCGTPAYPTEPAAQLGRLTSIENLGDPCLINISGVHIALSSADIFRYFKDRFIDDTDVAFVGHELLEQRSLYPVYPADKRSGLNIRLPQLLTRSKLNVRPHVLITPSSVAPFAKAIDGVVMVNPCFVVRGVEGGSFARMVVQPPENGYSGTMEDLISVRIQRV